MKLISYFESIGKWIANAFKKAPAIEVQISSAINYVVPFVEQLDELVAPEIAVAVNPVIDKIKTGLAALATTIKDSSPAGVANTTSILSSLKSNATLLETAFMVSNPDSQKKATSIINLIGGEFSAIQAELATKS